MGRLRKVRTGEEEREHKARRKEQNSLAEARRKQDPTYAARHAKRMQQARQDDDERHVAENAAK